MMLIRRHLGLLFGGHLLFHWIPIFFLVSGLPSEDDSLLSSPSQQQSQQTDVFQTQRRTGYACEGSSLTLSCDDPYLINLIRANFGRFSISTCNSQGNLEWSVNCKSPESFAHIQLNCNRKNRCLLPASSSFFGDPCPGTYKYLEVHYECVPKFQRPPGFSEVVRSPSSLSSSPSSSSSLSSLPSSSIPSQPSSSFSSFDDNWSLLPQSSFSSQSSPFSSSEQSLNNNKPKNQSPPPIIIPTINPYRTSNSPQFSPSPKIELVSEISPSPPPIDFEISTRSILDESYGSKFDENASRIYEESLYIPPSVGSSAGQLYYSNLENEGTIRILLILGSTLNSIILLIALVTLVLIRSLQTKESALIRKNVTINLLLDHLVLLLILGTYLSPNYFNTTSITTVSSISPNSPLSTNTSTLRSLGFLVALYHYFLLVHFVWILFDLDLELHVRLSRKQFVDPSLVLGPSGPIAASVNTSSTTATAASILTGGINPVKLRRYLYLTSYVIPLVVILLISWSTSTQALPMFANLCSLEARSHLASFVIASSIILTGLGLVLLLVTYSRIGLHTSSAGHHQQSAASPGSVGSFVYPPGLMTSADKFALDLMLNRKLKISLFCRFSLNLLAAINCTLGVVYLTYRVSTIGFLFALTNVSLGLFVFSYYCLTKENIRARYSLICSYAARHVFCFKGDSKSYLNNPHPVHGHHGHHPNVMHHLPLNSGLNGGLPRGIVVGAYNKNPSIQNLTGNPAQLSQPMIGNSTSMGALSTMAREFSASRHYLASDAATESGSDYGCRRLTPAAVAAAAAAAAAAVSNGSHMATHGPTPNHFYHLYNPKQSCNPYACHHMIEHVYECIDDEPYVAKVILPAGSTVASATLGNYRLHSIPNAATAGGDHGHHLHHLHHFQQTLPNHYLGYHNLESLHIRNAQFAMATGAPTSSTGSATLSTAHATSTNNQGTPVTCSSGLIGNALPAIVSDNSGRRTIICSSKSSSNLAHEADLTNGPQNTSNLGTFNNGNNEINNLGGMSMSNNNGGAPVLAVLGSNNRVISSFNNSQLQQHQQGINI